MPNCELCGEPMPAGVEMFKFHGYSGNCPKPPLPAAPAKAEFVRQEHGATVATIKETPDGCLEIMDLGGGEYDLIVHQRHGDTDRFDDISIRLKSEHFKLLGSIAAR